MSVSAKTGAAPGLRQKVKVERPRPLKMGGGTQPELGLEDLLVVVDKVTRGLAEAEVGHTNFDLKNQLEVLTANLKISGPALETSHRSTMDKLNAALMSACRLEQFPLLCRLHMLELLELRSMAWQSNPTLDHYYRQKLAQIEGDERPAQSKTAPVQSTVVNPFAFRASYQEGDGGREITNKPELQSVLREEKENKSAVTATSPLPGEIQCQGKKFFVTLQVQGDELTISGASMDLVKTAKIVLNEFFNLCPPAQEVEPETGDMSASSPVPSLELVKPDITYNKEQLLEIAKSSLCKRTPESWDIIVKELPGVVRRPGRAGPTSKLILREMEGLRRQEQAKNV